MACGGRYYSFLFRTCLGENLATLVPDSVARTPQLGEVVTTIVSWIPSVLAGLVVLRLARGRPRVPGELPDALAAAFRHIPASELSAPFPLHTPTGAPL